MDLQRALRDGPAYVRNAEDAIARNIPNADLLYMWDNQVNAIDGYLANTEPLNGESGDLSKLRDTLRDLKKKLELKLMEFEAKAEGVEVPEEPPAADVIEDLKAVVEDILGMADDALKRKVKDVRELSMYEDPRDLCHGFLADSEPYKSDQALAKAREDVRKRKLDLDARITAIEEEWRKKDLESGDDDD